MAGIIKRLIGPHVLIMLIGTAAHEYSTMTNDSTLLSWMKRLGGHSKPLGTVAEPSERGPLDTGVMPCTHLLFSGMAEQVGRGFFSPSGCIHGTLLMVFYVGVQRNGVYWLKYLSPGLLGSVGWVWGESQNHGMEKTSKIIKSNRQPNTATPAKPHPEVPHLRVF